MPMTKKAPAKKPVAKKTAKQAKGSGNDWALVEILKAVQGLGEAVVELSKKNGKTPVALAPAPEKTPAQPPVTEQATELFVTKQFGDGPVDGKEEVIAVHKFLTEPTRVTVDAGLTINLGNYETARIRVGISVPCYREEADAAYDQAYGWVTDRVEEETKKMRGVGKTALTSQTTSENGTSAKEVPY
jgi:hypothetical protein